MRRRFREFHEIKEAERSGGGVQQQQQYGQQDDGIDPLELKDTIEDDPDDYYDFEEEEEEVIDPLELKDTIEEDHDEEIKRYTVSVRVSCSVEREFEVGENPSQGELKSIVSEQMESISTEGIEDPSVVCLDELDIDEDSGLATESYAVNGWVDVDVSGVSADDAELKAIRLVDSGEVIPNPDIDEVSYDGDTIVREKAPEISREKRNVIEK